MMEGHRESLIACDVMDSAAVHRGFGRVNRLAQVHLTVSSGSWSEVVEDMYPTFEM